MILITASSFCSIDLCNVFGDIPPGYYSEPKEIQKNRFYTQSLKKEDARRGGDTFCNKLQKKLLIDGQ